MPDVQIALWAVVGLAALGVAAVLVMVWRTSLFRRKRLAADLAALYAGSKRLRALGVRRVGPWWLPPPDPPRPDPFEQMCEEALRDKTHLAEERARRDPPFGKYQG